MECWRMPLNDHEQKILEEIERQFRAEDPDLVRAATSLPLTRFAMRSVRLLIVGVVVGFLLMLATFSFNTIIALIGFVVMVGAATGLVQALKSSSHRSSAQIVEGGTVEAIRNRWPFRR